MACVLQSSGSDGSNPVGTLGTDRRILPSFCICDYRLGGSNRRLETRPVLPAEGLGRETCY